MSKRPSPQPEPDAHRIVVETDAFGDRVDVRVEPADPRFPDRDFLDARQARGWVSGIRLATGWAISDRTGGAA